MYAKRAELKVGVLVLLASVALFLLVYFASGESFWTDWRELHMRLQPGDLAPKKGDPIRINGVEVGKVDLVELHTATREGDQLTAAERAAIEARADVDGVEPVLRLRETYVLVKARVEARYGLPVSTKASISESVTGIRRLSLDLGGSPDLLPEDSTLENPIPLHQAADLLSIGDAVDRVMDEAATLVKTADTALAEVSGLIKDLREKLDQGHLERILEDLQETSAALRGAAETAEGRVEGIADDVKGAVADVKRLAASGASLLERLETEVPDLVGDVRGLVARVDGLVERAEPKVDAFLDDAAKTGQNLVKLSDEFASVGPEAQALLRGIGTDVEDLIEVLTDTGRNLLDASEDLRSHPWKLLNEPSPDQIAYDNLRLTTQSYVRAMQRMQQTARTLKDVLARGDTSDPVVQALVRKTLAEFESSVDRYRSLERRLVELLQQNAPPAVRQAPPAPVQRPPQPR